MTKGKIYEYAEYHNLFVEPEDKELFDEAKKEFLEYYFDSHTYDQMSDAMGDWFKKWFGDEET